ncbi:MAG: cobalamin-dependent protein [Thermodesulfovibrionales bacterium]
MEEKEMVEKIRTSIVSLAVGSTEAATQEALDAGVDPLRIVVGGLAAGLTEIGEMWIRKERFISHVLMAAKALSAGQALVEKRMAGKEGSYKAVVVLGTPKGDLHDIGKNLVGMMMRAAGFKVHDLGVDVEPQAFIDKAREVDADLIGMSLIMSICLDKMKEVCTLAKGAGIRGKTIIGGPATSAKVAMEIGADVYGGFDAPTAVRTAKQLLSIEA